MTIELMAGPMGKTAPHQNCEKEIDDKALKEGIAVVNDSCNLSKYLREKICIKLKNTATKRC
jgi:hypothetical protein